MDEREEAAVRQQIEGFAPVPVAVQTEAVQLNGQAAVIVRWKTPDNLNVSFWEPGQLEKIARQFMQIAVRARTGLVIPEENGSGVTDLNVFRDQSETVAETDIPSGPTSDPDVAE